MGTKAFTQPSLPEPAASAATVSPADSSAAHDLLREPRYQSAGNLAFLAQIEEYWNTSPGRVAAKLQNFPKYVSREDFTKFLARQHAFLQQLHVHGSIVDLGVGRGASIMTWHHLSAIHEPANYNRRIFGFDSFVGIPSTDDQDFQSPAPSVDLRIGGFSVEPGMRDDIECAIRIHDLTRFLGHIPKVELIVGDISTTLPCFLHDHPHLVVSLLNLDADAYRPTKVALQLLVPRMPKGGVIIFDELNSSLFPGETVAVDEVVGISRLHIQRLSFAPTFSFAIVE